MTVYLGNYPDPADGGVAYARQRDAIIEAIKTYGTDHISGVTVGNEFILNYLTDQGNSDSALANGPIGDAGAAILLPNVTDTRQALAALNLPKTIPVGNSEAGAYFNNKLLSAVDYGVCGAVLPVITLISNPAFCRCRMSIRGLQGLRSTRQRAGRRITSKQRMFSPLLR